MNVCAVRSLIARNSGMVHGGGFKWALQEDPLPHESDGRIFIGVELVRFPANKHHGYEERRMSKEQFCCKHCGSMFMEER